MEVPILLTPGPSTTSAMVRAAMIRDWGSRDNAFVVLTAELRARLVQIINASESHVAIPVSGPGTFAVEAVIATLATQREVARIV